MAKAFFATSAAELIDAHAGHLIVSRN